MSSIIAQHTPTAKKPRLISLATFLKRYSDMEDGYKYEFNNGIIEKTKTMNQEQTLIENALMRAFTLTQLYKEGANIFFEKSMYTSDSQLRKPDVSIYTIKQMHLMAKGDYQIAEWIAEVISDTDNINRVNLKLEEYFKAGVRVVWHIYPQIETVYVYTAADEVVICKGDKICSGAPAIPDFQITPNQLFPKN